MRARRSIVQQRDDVSEAGSGDVRGPGRHVQGLVRLVQLETPAPRRDAAVLVVVPPPPAEASDEGPLVVMCPSSWFVVVVSCCCFEVRFLEVLEEGRVDLLLPPLAAAEGRPSLPRRQGHRVKQFPSCCVVAFRRRRRIPREDEGRRAVLLLLLLGVLGALGDQDGDALCVGRRGDESVVDGDEDVPRGDAGLGRGAARGPDCDDGPLRGLR
mmetsp:Transcript_23697/g.76105  ORF Transcript_23697/g.76105 Transcript_23697/m.76105 type:complete len:212 (-) Transcript_23697:76-711(-)